MRIKVFCFYFCSGRGEEAVKSLASEGLKANFHQLDIDDLNSIKTAAAYFKEKYGGVDVLVNNAGIAFKSKITSLEKMYSVEIILLKSDFNVINM